jgi:outer membrane receptor protein involved in Fe transport
VEDVGNNFVAGGTHSLNLIRNRPHVSGSLSYYKAGWGGSHNVKFGGEIMRDSLVFPFYGFRDSRNAVSVFNNGLPSQVRVYLPPNVSENGLWTEGVYASDTWQVNRRLTLNLGLRFDRQQPYLPAQQGPGGESFPAIDKVLAWNNWGPRLGGSYDVTGDGKTVIKGNYGQYWLYPGADFASGVNPNPAGWFQQYAWTDLNRNGVWDRGEEGRLISVSGGRASTVFDPDLENTYVRQATVYAERELAPNFGVRTGFVWNGRRQVRAQINVNRPLGAYTVPVTIRDPGIDGVLGTGDDGATFAAYNLSAEALALPVVNITTNLPDDANSDYYTWEITATKRQTGRWSLLASFAQTFSHETNFGGGASFTPNASINTVDGRNNFKTWQGKIHATLNLPYDLRVTPIFRHQSGRAFARTFVQTLNWGNATILAERFGDERTANINVFDVRTEKAFRLQRSARVTGFFDVYNIFNTNDEQEVAVASGRSFLRPTAITPPRIARIGIKLDW